MPKSSAGGGGGISPTSDITTSGNLTVNNGNFNNLGYTGGLYGGGIGSYSWIMDVGGNGNIRLRDNGGSSPAGFSGLKTVLEAKTGAYTLLLLDSGKSFTNEGTAVRVDFTLPGAAAGLKYEFLVQDVDGIRVIAAAGDTIRNAAAVSAAAGRIDNAAIGSVVTLEAINATEWFVTSVVGTWTVT